MAEISASILEKKIIFKKYKLKKLLNTSEFSSVYEGKNLIKNTPVVIKIENKNKCNFLKSETYILINIKGFGFPEVISLGKYGPFNILIEELLGKNINELWESGPFKKDPLGKNNNYINDICLLAIQGIERLKYIHNKNIIHRDIKPKNFLIGKNDPDVIYLIDFGFAKKFRSSRTGKHIKFSNIKYLIGSLSFGSRNAIRGFECSRRDDLESLGYMLIYLAKGGWSPWSKYKKFKNSYDDITKIFAKIKMEITEENLCKGLPDEFIHYMKYVKNLDFEQEPDYQYLNSLFISILSKNNVRKNITFFWMKPNSKKGELSENKNNSAINALQKLNSRRNFAIRLYSKIKISLSKNTSKEKSSINYFRTINTDGNINFEKEKNKIIKYETNKNFNTIINNNKINTETNALKLEPIGKINNKMFKNLNNNSIKNHINISAKLNQKNKNEEFNLKFKRKNNNINNYSINNNNTFNHIKNIILCNNINYNNQYIINRVPTISKNNIRLKRMKTNITKKINDISINESNLNKNILYKPIFKKI